MRFFNTKNKQHSTPIWALPLVGLMALLVILLASQPSVTQAQATINGPYIVYSTAPTSIYVLPRLANTIPHLSTGQLITASPSCSPTIRPVLWPLSNQDFLAVWHEAGADCYSRFVHQADGSFSEVDLGAWTADWGATGPAADVNNDGYDDLLLIRTQPGFSDYEYKIALGQLGGTFNFTSPTIVVQNMWGAFFTLGDVDGDGKQDLVYHSFSSGGSFTTQIYMLAGNGDGTFEPVANKQLIVTGPSNTGTSQPVLADFNEDGHLDLFMPADDDMPDEAQNYIALNDGMGNFTVAESFDLRPQDESSGSDQFSASGESCDVDLDNHFDIIARGADWPNNTYSYSVHLGDGSAQFVENGPVIDSGASPGIFLACSRGSNTPPALECTPPPPDMVGWWHFDEMTGTLAADIAMYPNDGTHINNPTPITGVVDGALSFAGTQQANQYVEVPHHNEIDFDTGDLSIDAWIRTDSNQHLEIFIDKREDTAIGPVGYSFHLENGRLAFQLADDSSSWYNYWNSTGPDLRDGQWHFVAATVDRDQPIDGLKLYIDGNLIEAFDPTNRPDSISNDGDLWIGKHHANSAYPIELWFDGDLDEVEFFNRVLTPDEIWNIYNANSAGKCKGEIHGQKFHDLNGNGQKDDGEPGLEGWTILLKDADGNVISTVTDEEGNYWFMGLRPGSYTVAERLTDRYLDESWTSWEGWSQTSPTTGTHSVDLASGEVVENVDFGNWQEGKDDFCKMPWDNHFLNEDSLETSVYIFNASSTPQKAYTLQLIGLPAGTEEPSDLDGSTTFDILSPLPIALNPNEFGVVDIRVYYPPSFNNAYQRATFQAIVTNVDTGQSFACTEALWSVSPDWWLGPNVHSGIDNIPIGFTEAISFTVSNTGNMRDRLGTTGDQANFTIHAMDPITSSNSSIISLNGLEAGKSVSGTISLAPGESQTISVDVKFMEHIPLGVSDILFELDIDGDGEPDAVNSVLVRSVEEIEPGEIHGQKFHDLNGNGVKDPREPGLEGWTILLQDAAGNVISTVTDDEGNYWFMDLLSGTYTVAESHRKWWAQTHPESGTHTVTLQSGEVVEDIKFGNWQYSDEYCAIGWDVHLNPNWDYVEIYLQIINFSTNAHQYDVELMGLPGLDELTNFTITPPPPISVPAGSDREVKVRIDPLPNFNSTSGPYQAIITNQDSGYSFGCSGQIWAANNAFWLDAEGGGIERRLTFGEAQTMNFPIHNFSDEEMNVRFEIEAMVELAPNGNRSRIGDGLISLNGKPAGEKITGTISVPAGEVGMISSEVELTQDVSDFHGDIILSVDYDNDGNIDAATSIMIGSGPTKLFLPLISR